MHIKAELAARADYLALDVGGTLDGLQIISTVPNSPHVILDVPGTGAEVRARMSTLVQQGAVIDWRREHDTYAPLWIPPGPEALDAVPLFEIGDTYPTEALRALGSFGAGVLIGIVDTGCWPGHACFDGVGLEGVDGSADLQDPIGHGTACASILVGRLVTDSLGIVRDYGIARQARLLMGRGLDQPNGSGSETTIANKLRRLADRGCQVISLSLGGSASSVIDAAVEYAKQRGAVVVAAAGNTPNAALGSPARAADLVVLAVDRQRAYASFTSGTNWSTGNRLTDYGVRIRSASKDAREGSFEWDGTSAACPHTAGKAACLRGGGLDRQQTIGYLLGHRVSPPSVGVAELAADYGSAPGEGDNVDEVRAQLEAIQAECDRDGLRYWDIKPQDSRLDVEAFARDVQASLGIIHERAGIGLDALGPKVPGPEPEPAPEPEPPPPDPPPVSVAYGGSYGTSHSPAVDVYPGGPWGPHHGYVVRAPAPGRVELYTFPTPLETFAAMSAEEQATWHALFDGWECMIPPAEQPEQDAAAGTALPDVEPLQTMYVAVFRPDQPQQLPDGAWYRAAWGGHCRQDVRVGPVAEGDSMWVVWDTGVRFEDRGIPARAAHCHAAGSRMGTLTPNGDIDGALIWEALTGQRVERINAPSPEAYLSGRYCAGRLRSDFDAAGKPIPPMPA